MKVCSFIEHKIFFLNDKNLNLDDFENWVPA